MAKIRIRFLAALVIALSACANADLVRLANAPYADGLGSNSAGRYRIPAMAKSTNGTIVAVYDCRYNSSGDLPNAIDLAECWSGDNGATWTGPQAGVDVPNTNNYEKACNIGDPCVVYDPAGDRFWLMGITGGGLASSHKDGVSIADVVLYTRGTGENDKWQEWTGGPAGNRRSVKQMILDSLADVDSSATNDENEICGILQGPGHGIVQRQTVYASDGETVLMPAGALIFPMQYFSTRGNFNAARTFAAYSIDGGVTWKATKLTDAGENAQENCVMELDDGSWYMICKGKTQSQKQRQLFHTRDFVNWSYCGSITPSEWVQGSCLRLGEGQDGKGRYVACFSPSGRNNVTLHFGIDTTADDPAGNGIDWCLGKRIVYSGSTGGMGYNSLVMIDDNTLGILIEANGHIYFVTEDVSDILAMDKLPPPTPVAVWDGDFTATQTGYTLNINGNKLSDDNSTLTITNTYAGLDINAASSFANGVTLLVRYSNLAKAGKAKVLATSCNDINYRKDRTGVDLQGSDGDYAGKLMGMWYNNGWSGYGDASLADIMPTNGVYAFTYEKSLGTYLYAGASAAQISAAPAFGASGLKSSGDTIWGVSIGGMRSDTINSNWRAAQNMEVTAIAVFDKVLSTDEMNAYEWPVRVLFSNTNATPDVAYWNVSGTQKITIPAGLTGDLAEDKFVKICSLDFGYYEDTYGYTHAKKISIKSGNTVWTSANVVTNSVDVFPGKNNGTVPRLVYSFAKTDCVLAVDTPYEISLLDDAGAPLTKIRYALAKDADKIITGMDYDASFTPMMQLVGEVLSGEEAGFAGQIFDWTPGSAPTGSWFTAWKGENGGAPKTVVGPDGTAQSMHVTFKDGDGDSEKWIPYCSDDAKGLTNFTFVTYGCADMVRASSGKYAVLWCMGRKDNEKTALVKDENDSICLAQVTGTQQVPTRTITAGAVKGYHLFTVRFSTTGGASLQIDDGQIIEDPNFTTVAHAGFQVGSVRSGCSNPFEMGQGFAVLKMRAFESSEIPSAQHAALCAQYPAVETMYSLDYEQDGGTLLLPSLTLTGGKLSVQQGTLGVPGGVEASLSAFSLGDKQGSPSFGMNLDGTLMINTSSSFNSNDPSEAYSDMKYNARGVVFGEWTGSGTVDITGRFLASNTVVSLCHDSASVAINVVGGTFVAKGITAMHDNRAALSLSNGGMVNLGLYPSCDYAINKTYGIGTVTGAADWTDTDAITLNGEGNGTTFLADGINLVFSGPVTGSGNATIDAPNGGSVDFKDWRGTGDVIVKAGSLKALVDTSMDCAITIMDGGALDIATDGAAFSSASFTAQSITVQEGGSILVNGAPASGGYTVDVSGGNITITPNITDDNITHECVLRISEIMPKPTDAQNHGALEGMDVNGLESGWVEVENASDKWADLADYRFIRVNRGKKTDPAGFGNFPSRYVAPHSRTVFYTSERYSNSKDKAVSAFEHGTFDGKPMAMGDDLNNILVWGDKVNPKKSPYVRLYYAPGGDSDKGTAVDTVVVPSDLPEGWSIIVGDAAEGEGTRRWMCPTPTRGKVNSPTAGLKRIGPNVGPLYEKKGQKKTDFASEFAVPTPPATPGEDYIVTLPINGVMNPDGTFTPRSPDRIQAIKFVYRKDLDDSTLTTNAIDVATKSTVENWGDQYTATIPASYFPAAGHLMQWKVLITDGEGVEWTSPSFNNPDDGYEWYGTIVAAPELESATLQTWHMFAVDDHLAQMDYDKDDKEHYTLENGARVAIYDSSTSNYYDYVRIDLRGNTSAKFTKKGHGLRFAKAHPLTMRDCVTGETIEDIRKTSLISEFADPSYMRQMIAFWLWRKMGNLVPFDFPVRCNLNGEFYQLAFNSERFTDELIEDVYGLDKFGYGYKNVGTLNLATTTAGAIEKKTPDDEDESNVTVLINALVTPLQQNGANTTHSSSENASLTKFVVQELDLPAWLNYLASARITQEMDDVWANVCAYYDNPDMKEGVRGKGTWMPLGYDFNLTFGQYYINDLDNNALAGLSATNDWFKSHPLYGGWTIRARKSASGSLMNGNNGFEAIYQSPKFRRLYLRRLRTLMDQELKEPGTATNDTPFMVKMREMANLMRDTAELDLAKWKNDSSDNAIDVWKNATRPANMDAGIQDIWDNYVVPRREHLYVTHSVTNTAKAIGYGSNLNAGIPEAQSPIATLAPNIELDFSHHAEGVVVVSNLNNEVVDMSGWTLRFGVDWTLPPGTVCDSNDCIYVVRDRRTFIADHESDLTDEVIVGNAGFSDWSAVYLDAADGTVLKGVSAGDGLVTFEAKDQKAADKLVAELAPALTEEDRLAGLEPQYLKVVAEPTGKKGEFAVALAVNPETVSAPVVGVGESAEEDEPVEVEDEEGRKTVSVSISNAIIGLWYGYEVADELDGESTAFDNDIGSFERATGTAHTVKGSPRTQPNGFFRVKVLPAKPTTKGGI